MMVLMRGHVACAHHLHAVRHSGTDECIDKNAGVEQCAPELECVQIVADDDGNNGGLTVQHFETHLFEPPAHFICIGHKPPDEIRFSFEDIQRRKG